MRLREARSTYGAVVDIDPDSGGQKVAVARTAPVYGNGDFQSMPCDDEIESEEEDDEEEKRDEISDDSSNLEDEVPVATKLGTGRVRRRKVRLKRGNGGDVAAGGKRRATRAAPRDWLLKYLQPNVSNVADRSDCGNAGIGLLIGRESSRPARQSKERCKDSSSSGEEQEQPPSAGLANQEKPEGTPVVHDEGMGDSDDEDFTDSEVLAFTNSNDAIKDRPISEKANLKDQAGKAQETPVSAITDCLHPFGGGSFSVATTQADNFEISPRKPLAQIYQRDLESVKRDVPEGMPQTREKIQKENEAPRKRKLTLAKDSRRQSSLKSFLKPFPVL